MNFANSQLYECVTTHPRCYILRELAELLVVSEPKDDDVCWCWSGATWTTEGCPDGEHGGVNRFGVQTKGNANFAWMQYFIHHLAPQTACAIAQLSQREASPQVVSEAKGNMAGFVLANGCMTSNQSGEGDIRRALIEADLVDCMVALASRSLSVIIRRHEILIPISLSHCPS
jgi:hypothetical protein